MQGNGKRISAPFLPRLDDGRRQIALTQAQADGVRDRLRQMSAAQRSLTDYLGAVLDGACLDGAWALERLDGGLLTVRKETG